MRWQIAFLAMTFAGAAPAQPPSPAASAAKQAQIANGLYAESCLAHFGNERALSAWVDSKGLSETRPEMSSAVLQGDVGTVWSASNEHGDFLVLLVSGGNCEVWARRADAKVAARLFENALQGAQRPGRRFEREKDREIEAGGVKYRQISYFMTQDKVPGGWAFIAIVADSDKADVQVRLSADRVK